MKIVSSNRFLRKELCFQISCRKNGAVRESCHARSCFKTSWHKNSVVQCVFYGETSCFKIGDSKRRVQTFLVPSILFHTCLVQHGLLVKGLVPNLLFQNWVVQASCQNISFLKTSRFRIFVSKSPVLQMLGLTSNGNLDI